jgi:hypothetical protein
MPVFAPWTGVALVALASAAIIRPVWAAPPVWLAAAALARALGASRSYAKALRRLTVPAAVVVAAGWLAWLLPPVAGTLLVVASLPLAGWEARLARFRRASSLGLPLVLLAAALVFSAWRR